MSVRHVIFVYFLFAVGAAAAQAQSVRTVPVGENIEWSYARDGSPARYRSGGVTLTMRGRAEADPVEVVAPVLTVEVPGFASVEVEGSPTPAQYDHRVTVGRWDGDRPFVLFQSYSGGAHCCMLTQVILPEAGRLRVVELGDWDGGGIEEVPADIDGDGRIDFVFRDNGFLYAFASYADSFAPPLIMNIVDGEAVDVSTRPGFRPLFEADMRESRERCVDPQDSFPNGACASYVASAARLGRFDRAWAEMLTAYDRSSDWPLPGSCRVDAGDEACPEGQQLEFEYYPDALRGFLIDLGYIERGKE